MTQERAQYKVKGPLVIVELLAENVKKVKAVRIRPDGSLVQITGLNGNGKTSVLDCIWLALDQKVVDASMPIRNGAQSARIKLDMGEIVVERRITQKGSTLEIFAAETGVQKFASGIPTSLAAGKPGTNFQQREGAVKDKAKGPFADQVDSGVGDGEQEPACPPR